MSDPGLTPPAPSPAEQAAEFQRRLAALTPRVFVTPALIALNVGVFVLMAARGVSLINPTPEQLIAWGANYGPKTLNGEWWRLLTCTFLHIGIIHLLLNMWVLAEGGPLVERLLGNLGFAVLYLVSGVGGSLASVGWDPLQVSAGASGAIFGIYGALLSSMLSRRDSIPLGALTRLRNSGLAFLGYNLAFGLFMPGIDMAAHVGGLAAGFLSGAALSHTLAPEAVARRRTRSLAVAGGAALLILLGVWALPRGGPDLHEALARVAATEEAAINKYNDTVKQVQSGHMTEAEQADILERDVLPPWRAERERLAALQGVPAKFQKLLATYLEYLRARQESWELLVQAIREDDAEKALRARQKGKAADQLLNKINAQAAKGN
jgi:rhomboid protease GluP